MHPIALTRLQKENPLTQQGERVLYQRGNEAEEESLLLTFGFGLLG